MILIDEQTSTVCMARAPLRLGFAGGGTDVSPFCDLYGGCVINATISKHAYAKVKYLNEPKIVFNAADLGCQSVFDLEDNRLNCQKLPLHAAVYRRLIKDFNQNFRRPVELTTFCDAPIGSGLGSSSTLVVAMIKAFTELLDVMLDDNAVATLAYEIERHDCKLNGGRQDQFAAAFGGFNFMEFISGDRAVVTPLTLEDNVTRELEASLLLYHTGISRHSAEIIANQSENVENRDEESLAAMKSLKVECSVMKDALLRGDLRSFANCLKVSWEQKKKMSKLISNQTIDQIFTAAMSAGALAGKVSGAGGGGFMMFIVPIEDRKNLTKTLLEFGGEVDSCNFTNDGAVTWRQQQ